MAGTVQLAGVRRAPPLPSPRAPIKGSPRAPSSLHRPRPFPSSPSPSTIREASSSSSSPVSPFPLLPLPLRWSSEKLSEPSSSLTRPRTRSTTFQPPSPTQSPPAAPSQPSPSELGLPLESPASARAKPPSLGPRTGPPAANRRQAHRRPALLPRSAGSPHRLAATPLPPRSRWQVGPQQRRHPRDRAVSPSLMGHRWAVSAPARALAPGVGQKPCP
jgi:hypothetical protein